MKAAVLYHPGAAENFVIEERPIPQPGEGQVLVKIKAFGLNRSELMTRKGLSPSVQFPRVLGIECVGEIEEDPSGEYKKGQQVAALMGEMGRAYDGGYEEYAVLPESIIYPFKSTLPWQQLGAFPEMFQTVYGSLHLSLKIKEGETLLIRGGTSSIGMLAAQLAKNMHVTVIATTRKEESRQLLTDNGATHVLIDNGHLEEQLRAIYPAGVDKVLELVGTVTLADSLRCANEGGSVCMTGMLSETWSMPNFVPMDVIPSTVNLTTYSSDQISLSTHTFQNFLTSVETGRVNLNVSRVFQLEDIVEAHKFMESNKAGGKIVVLTSHS
ncbi:zinc-binding dehydrogenase [Chitinophaga oryziterrae]|uniref:Zinc-binding dehydrogenase n=1 Tax=Chitinophaga oryziterrae TaxID=1031224 RepID=A0A6N8J964_9BACT|nr:zinc-binding alcohol dehydrogenase family protein [Chitinophaga oryziterrae]MVT41663.1 zinc-binding dehydrogenase [Chitinophaga oryziterrae]